MMMMERRSDTLEARLSDGLAVVHVREVRFPYSTDDIHGLIEGGTVTPQ
tara:strand:+ start:331 stop:477 length:147 start_codon:yes stop_codon:yes gene_type:complete